MCHQAVRFPMERLKVFFGLKVQELRYPAQQAAQVAVAIPILLVVFLAVFGAIGYSIVAVDHFWGWTGPLVDHFRQSDPSFTGKSVWHPTFTFCIGIWSALVIGIVIAIPCALAQELYKFRMWITENWNRAGKIVAERHSA